MLFSDWWSRRKHSKKKRPNEKKPRNAPRFFEPGLQMLEDRRVLSGISVAFTGATSLVQGPFIDIQSPTTGNLDTATITSSLANPGNAIVTANTSANSSQFYATTGTAGNTFVPNAITGQDDLSTVTGDNRIDAQTVVDKFGNIDMVYLHSEGVGNVYDLVFAYSQNQGASWNYDVLLTASMGGTRRSPWAPTRCRHRPKRCISRTSTATAKSGSWAARSKEPRSTRCTVRSKVPSPMPPRPRASLTARSMERRARSALRHRRTSRTTRAAISARPLLTASRSIQPRICIRLLGARRPGSDPVVHRYLGFAGVDALFATTAHDRHDPELSDRFGLDLCKHRVAGSRRDFDFPGEHVPRHTRFGQPE